jgi:hypothetical protein
MRTALVLVAFTCGIAAGGCSRLPDPAPTPGSAGPRAEARDVRYNAVLALLHRGSPRVKDEGVWDVLTEMLDEEQLVKDFQSQSRDGRPGAGETAARMTVIGTLRAVRELHQKRPEVDLTGLRPQLDKLTQSSNAAVRAEANEAHRALFPPT